MTLGQWAGLPLDLFRDPVNGKVAGVCAGLGRYFQVRPKMIRLALIMGSVFGLFIPLALLYGLATLLIPPMPEGHATADGSPTWTPSSDPEAVGRLFERFQALEQRLALIETTVTSEEFRLRQKFRDL